MYTQPILAAILSLAVTGGLTRTTDARTPSVTVGDFITTRYQTQVMDQQTPLATIQGGTNLTALDVNGSWVLVAVERNGKMVRGWVRKRHIRIRPDCGYSSVTFDNQSGESALVRLVGPTHTEMVVGTGQSRTIRNVAAGHYRMLVRYRTAYGHRHVKGEHFDVKATSSSYAKITITLHGVVAGNYSSWPATESEFDAAAPGRRPSAL